MNSVNARLLIVCATIITLLMIVFSSIVILELAGKPVSTLASLEASAIIPTVIGLLTFATATKMREEIKNGVGTSIAKQAATFVATDVAARASLGASDRHTDPDPPLTIPSTDPPTQEGAA